MSPQWFLIKRIGKILLILFLVGSQQFCGSAEIQYEADELIVGKDGVEFTEKEKEKEKDSISNDHPSTIVSATPSGFKSIRIEFSKPVEKELAENMQYSISPDRVPGISVVSAELDSQDDSIVHLTLSHPMLPIEYTLSVEDPAMVNGSANALISDGEVTFQGNGRVAFATKSTGTGDLSTWAYSDETDGLEGADKVCQTEAELAGLTGEFKAWMSNGLQSARDRLSPNPGPWIRTDGFPLVLSFDDLLRKGVMVPLVYHADGTRAPDQGIGTQGPILGAPFDPNVTRAFTGTSTSGFSAAGNCNAWSSTEGTARFAVTVRAGRYWSRWTIVGNGCSKTARLFCFQTGEGPKISDIQTKGKLVFLSSISVNGNFGSSFYADGASGIQAGDNICKNLADRAGIPNANNFKALVSAPGNDVRSRIQSDGPWAMKNGVLVAQNKADLFDGSLFTSIRIDENGIEKTSFLDPWTGSTPAGLADEFTCQGWDVNIDNIGSVRGLVGANMHADAEWTEYLSFGVSCSRSQPLYCIED